MIISEKKTAGKFTGKKAMMWFMGFFGVVFTVNGIMLYIALSTWGGVETEHAYRKGLFYNREIAAAENQAKSGWKISLDHQPISLSGDTLAVNIARPDGDLPPEKVTVFISRAVTNAYDKTITLDKLGENQYGTPLILPLPGQWDVDIRVYRADGTLYQLKEKIFIAAQE